jgi:hypothetical protein
MENQKPVKEFKTIKAEAPSVLHDKFKEKCRKKDTQMNKVLIRLVSEYCNQK